MSIDTQRGVFYISAGNSFVDELAGGIIDRFNFETKSLSDLRILLPTRRACRALAEAFLRVNEGESALLPDLVPIGDIEQDELSMLNGDGEVFMDSGDIPPAIPNIRRQLLLTGMILAKDSSLPVAHGARLAAELARLLDEVQTERLSFTALGDIVPEKFSAHWQEMLVFLNIVTEHWPKLLGEQGCLDPADRRNRVIEAQIRAWQKCPPRGPVIVAGSTGSIPATADLIACVAGLEKGSVVLPGLDNTLDAESAAALSPSHPQYGIIQLLKRLHLEIEDVACWGTKANENRTRSTIINKALRPFGVADKLPPAQNLGASFDNLMKVACPGPQQEALVIALMLREALENGGKSAALITPDRRLARRVSAELKRWKIEIDDSGGTPLEQTLPGAFLNLVAEAVVAGAAPIPLLAALKHPLASGGLNPADFRNKVREMELLILRGPRPEPGFPGLLTAIKKVTAPQTFISWVEGLSTSAAPFSELLWAKRVSPAKLLDSHIYFAETLASTEKESGTSRLWGGDAGAAAAEIVNEIRSAVKVLQPISGQEWPALFRVLLKGSVVRPKFRRHPKLHIWGLLEARLQQADLTILGGLNEGVWPPEPANDPWMSRPMRETFGLVPPERRIGLTAHDFVQAVTAPKVFLTRSTRLDGAPTVQARWITRIETFLLQSEIGIQVLRTWQQEEDKWIYWQSMIDSRLEPAETRAPEPRPPISTRPDRLSVTEVEKLIRDPYEIYARKVLRLRAMDPIDADPGAAERGSIIHRVVDRFFRQGVVHDRTAALENFLEIGREEFAPWLDRPGIWAFWWPRFERIADWIFDRVYHQSKGVVKSQTEVNGKLVFSDRARPFTLTARADRIDILAGGGYGLIDYKTGSVPTKRDVNNGVSPQLPLEGAMIGHGAFIGIDPAPVEELSYWKLSGGDPAGYIRAAGNSSADLIRLAIPRLMILLDHYDKSDTAYLARPDADIAPSYSDYDHLERVQEWAIGDD